MATENSPSAVCTRLGRTPLRVQTAEGEFSVAMQEGRDFILQCALEDELGSQSADLRESVRVADPLAQQGVDLFLDAGARCYPAHGRSPSFGSFVPYLRSLRLFTFPANP